MRRVSLPRSSPRTPGSRGAEASPAPCLGPFLPPATSQCGAADYCAQRRPGTSSRCSLPAGAVCAPVRTHTQTHTHTQAEARTHTHPRAPPRTLLSAAPRSARRQFAPHNSAACKAAGGGGRRRQNVSNLRSERHPWRGGGSGTGTARALPAPRRGMTPRARQGRAALPAGGRRTGSRRCAAGRGAGAALPPSGAGARRRRRGGGREAGRGAAASRLRAGCPASLPPPRRGSPARSRGCGAQSGGGGAEDALSAGRRRGRGAGQWRVPPAGPGTAPRTSPVPPHPGRSPTFPRTTSGKCPNLQRGRVVPRSAPPRRRDSAPRGCSPGRRRRGERAAPQLTEPLIGGWRGEGRAGAGAVRVAPGLQRVPRPARLPAQAGGRGRPSPRGHGAPRGSGSPTSGEGWGRRLSRADCSRGRFWLGFP